MPLCKKYLPFVFLNIFLLPAPAYSTAETPPGREPGGQQAVRIVNPLKLVKTVILAYGGDAKARFTLAAYYEYKKNYAGALKWMRKAAEQGYVDAQFSLGAMYYEGEYVKADRREAMKWFKLAAEQGRAAAQSMLGTMYYAELQDYDQAVIWMRKAADQGYGNSQYILGHMYESGGGVDGRQNYESAVEWYSKAASQGHGGAQYALGRMYARGLGAARNYMEAYKWNYLAAEQKNPEAISALETFDELLTPSQIAGAKSRASELLKQTPRLPAEPD